MTPSATVSYPPAAHLSSDGPSDQPGAVTLTQPAPVPAMSLRSSALDDKSKLQTGRAERIRGGCIPCPDGSICYIIPIPCCC